VSWFSINLVASNFWFPVDLLVPVQGLFYQVFFFTVKRIRENKTREGLSQISTCQLQKRKEKLISYNVLYEVILINQWFGTQYRISMFQEKVPNILNYLPVINGSQDVIVSIVARLIAGWPRSHGSNPSRVKRLCAFPTHANQFWDPHILFPGFWRWPRTSI